MQQTSSSMRPPAVAGMFYPADAVELRSTIEALLAQATHPQGRGPKAIIAPHAGYIYSGPIAAQAYARLAAEADLITRVVLLGPCHRVAVRGLAAPTVAAFATPLGPVEIDQAALRDLPFVHFNDAAHAAEHSLEVQLPFLRIVTPHARVVPLAVGDAQPDEVALVLERLWGGPETRIVISSDLSHYLPYATAQQADLATAQAIESLDYAPLTGMHACGYLPISGLLTMARRRSLGAVRLDLRNSGDTAGPRDRVVGYGAWAFA
jgi:AmmeMemoRadiSam system protein B